MIARIWHGRVPAEKSDAYWEFTKGRAIPDYKSVSGNRGVYILRRSEGAVAHFLTLTFWDSMDAVRNFAGEDAAKAKYYPEDDNYLLEFEPMVRHYEVYSEE